MAVSSVHRLLRFHELLKVIELSSRAGRGLSSTATDQDRDAMANLRRSPSTTPMLADQQPLPDFVRSPLDASINL